MPTETYTPGPWYVEDHYIEGLRIKQVSTHKEIAALSYEQDSAMDREGNASLISKAPQLITQNSELLAVLRTIAPFHKNGLLEDCWTLARRHGEHALAEQLTAWGNEARAVLALVEDADV